MFVERKLSATSGAVELWWAEHDSPGQSAAKTILVRKVGEEQPIAAKDSAPREKGAICWAAGRTLGNIAVNSPLILAAFPGKQGDNAILPCDFVHAGKFRHGPNRWWCRTHQNHWGTKADVADLQQSGKLRCADHSQQMNYVVDPFTVNLDDHAEVGVWCSLPAALSSFEINPRPPKIHVHVRDTSEDNKRVDRDFAAVSVIYGKNCGLFDDGEVVRVDITPPSAFDFICAVESGRELGSINCSYCGYPHLDLGDFGKTPHRKHFCGNCGRDSTWSNTPIISTPLKVLHDRSAKDFTYETPDRSLNLDDYGGCTYSVWASTPAIVWTAARPQEFGIHVHVHRGTERIIDDTFGKVILGGKQLDRGDLLQAMIRRSIV